MNNAVPPPPPPPPPAKLFCLNLSCCIWGQAETEVADYEKIKVMILKMMMVMTTTTTPMITPATTIIAFGL